MSTTVRTDRYGRAVLLDRYGLEYVRGDDGEAWYITPCCDASAKGWETGTVCRACFRDIDPALGGIVEPLPEDMTDKDRAALEWSRDMTRRFLQREREEEGR